MPHRFVRRRRFAILSASITLTGFIPLDDCLAADRAWTNTAGGNFLTTGNWAGGAIPGAVDRAIFDATSSATTYTVTFSGNVATDRLLINDPVVFDLGGTRTYSINSGDTTQSIVIGSATTGVNRLALQNGTLTTVGGMALGDVVDSDGSLTIGSGGVLDVSQTFISAIGQRGSGTLAIRDGGQFTSVSTTLANFDTAEGTLTIADSGSSLNTGSMIIGNSGPGFFNVRLGGVATFGTQIRLGSNSTGVGTMLIGDIGGGTVTGAGSILVGANGAGHVRIDGGAVTCGTMLISTGSFNGVLGTGSVEIRGGALNTGRFDIGLVGSGSATIGGTSSTAQLIVTGTAGTTIGSGSFASWLLRIINNGTASMGAGATVVGNNGVGTLEVLNDGVYAGTGTLVFGLNPQSAGSGLVSGNGASLTCGSLIIGSSGTGELRVLDGADVAAQSVCTIGATSEGTGTVLVSGAGSQLTTTQSIQVAPLGTGVLVIEPGARVATGNTLEVRTGSGGEVHLRGGTLSAGTLGGTGLFDFASGTLNITGFIGGGLVIGAGGPLGSSFVVDPTRRLNVTQTLTNSGLVSGHGTLSAGSFVNSAGGEIRVSGAQELTITAGSISNSGQINLFGGLLETSGTVVNNASGRISGRGVLRAASVQNSGTIALSAGVADVFGNLTNAATGKAIVTGNATAVFYNDVTNLAGSEFRVSSGATAVFLGAVTGLGQFTGSGTTIFEGPASLGVIDRTGTTLVEASGSLVASHVRENALIVNGPVTILPNGTSAATSRVRSLLIDGGRLDLNNNDLVIDYTGASPIQTVREQLQSGYANGAWTGEGIATSMGNASNLGLGYAEASAIFSTFPATFSGQSVDNTSILVAFTRFGDANVDGLVNLTDFNRLASNFGGTDRVWSQGDFNYDGLVNLTDFNRLASNFGLSAEGPDVTPEDWAALASAVPEPAGWAVGVIGLLASARRRNRKERAACDTSIHPR